MADEILHPAPDHAEAKARLGDVDPTEAARKPTPLQSALEKWEKYLTPEEQAALRAYQRGRVSFRPATRPPATCVRVAESLPP